MAIVWYVLIHVSLGLIGYQYFQFSNLGAIYAALASAMVPPFYARGAALLRGGSRRRVEGAVVSGHRRTKKIATVSSYVSGG